MHIIYDSYKYQYTDPTSRYNLPGESTIGHFPKLERIAKVGGKNEPELPCTIGNLKCYGTHIVFQF